MFRGTFSTLFLQYNCTYKNKTETTLKIKNTKQTSGADDLHRNTLLFK